MIHLELFAGISSGDTSLGILEVDPSKIATYPCEHDPCLVAKIKTRFPSSPIDLNVMDLVEADCDLVVRRIRYHQADGIRRTALITAGFPCQDLSSAKKGTRLGLLGKRSCLFAAVVLIISALTKLKDELHIDIAFLVENVASMSANWKRLLNKAFGVTAKDIDLSQTCPVRRKRLLWTNISGISMSPRKS